MPLDFLRAAEFARDTRGHPTERPVSAPARSWIQLDAETRRRAAGWLRRAHCCVDDIADITGDALTRVMEQQIDLRTAADPWSLIRRELASVWADWTRVRRREAPEPDWDTTLPLDVACEPVTDDDNDDKWPAIHRHIADATNQLTTRQGEAIALYVIEGLSYAEAARLMLVKEATVRVLVSQGLARLRETLSTSDVGCRFASQTDTPRRRRARPSARSKQNQG